MDSDKLRELATRYTAWCSQDAASVASFYSERGSLKVNDGDAAVGRESVNANSIREVWPAKAVAPTFRR